MWCFFHDLWYKINLYEDSIYFFIKFCGHLETLNFIICFHTLNALICYFIFFCNFTFYWQLFILFITYIVYCTTLLMYDMVKRKKLLLHDQTVYIYIYLHTIRLSIPITMWSLKWIGQEVLNLERDIGKIVYNLMNKVP
jgi:hypothetical protein